jgi:cytochrome c553
MKILKWSGIALGAILSLVCLALIGLYFASQSKMQTNYAIAAEPITVASDSALVARGRHLVTAVSGCVGCHGDKLAGTQMIDAPVFARIAASNLTAGAGGVKAKYTDALFERAIRHGVNADGRSMAIMPVAFYNGLADDDLRAIIAYVKSVPAVDHEVKPFSAGPISRGLIMSQPTFLQAGSITHDAPHRVAPTPGVTTEFGEYLVTIAACKECHGANLAGGPLPDGSGKLASNLTPAGLAAYTEDAFVTAIREGKRPVGAPIDTLMPWRVYRGMTDQELKAIWAYLRTVPAKTMGQRD